jgi:phosphatidylserine decarboxylase
MGLKHSAERAFVRVFSSPRPSRAVGRLADLELPGPLMRAVMRAYIGFYGVDMKEVEAPLASFKSFNEFFTRRLKDGARPVDARPEVLVSPSDSRVVTIGRIPEDGRLHQVKDKTYSLRQLLGDDADAARFSRGVHAILYLSPSMYHRVHCPVDGRVVGWRHIPGRLFPVNDIAVRQVDSLFAVNERLVVMIESETFGPVAAVLVGAANVGRITLAFSDLATNMGQPAVDVRPEKPLPIRRGDDLGAFNLGSTVVLLAAAELEPLVPPGTFVKMGAPLWRTPAGYQNRP